MGADLAAAAVAARFPADFEAAARAAGYEAAFDLAAAACCATGLFGPRPVSVAAIVPPAPFNAGAMLQLTDGTVMVHDQGPKNSGSRNWWRLTPDINGSYLNGTWSKLAPLPDGYAPLYFACAVLADGRVIIEGGEYNNGQEVFSPTSAHSMIRSTIDGPRWRPPKAKNGR
jgi:hypothetical protein